MVKQLQGESQPDTVKPHVSDLLANLPQLSELQPIYTMATHMSSRPIDTCELDSFPHGIYYFSLASRERKHYIFDIEDSVMEGVPLQLVGRVLVGVEYLGAIELIGGGREGIGVGVLISDMIHGNVDI